jgi:hypothetical protein
MMSSFFKIACEWTLGRVNQELGGAGRYDKHTSLLEARKSLALMAREMGLLPTAEVTAKTKATIYTLSFGATYEYRVTCIHGMVDTVDRYRVQTWESGDGENGPSLSSCLVFEKTLSCSIAWHESDLDDSANDIIADAEAYSDYRDNTVI